MNIKKDTAPYGRELAESVARWLQKGVSLHYSHRDYCGTGFTYQDNKYVYGEVDTGEFSFIIQSFVSEILFVEWLAKQCDFSLARLESIRPSTRDNQVITRARLLEFINEAPLIHQETKNRLKVEEQQRVLLEIKNRERLKQEQKKWMLLKEKSDD